MADDNQAEMAPAGDGETPEPAQNNQPESLDSLKQQMADMAAALKKANKEAAKYRHQASQFEDAEQKRKEAEMSEMEKLQAKLAQAESELQRVTLDRLKQRIATEMGLPAALASRLQGADEDELKADAEALLKTLPKQQQAPQIKPTNPGANAQDAKPTDKQRLSGIYGGRTQVFDPVRAAQHGGGVIWRDAD